MMSAAQTTIHSLTHTHTTDTNDIYYRPEALGIVPGAVFLVCLIFCLVGYASTTSKLLEINAALLSVCFMLFLGFTDDVLDWPWRYKRTWTLALMLT
jgi:UDP-N-acetylmuramyl pentapeptide phosphotransferase/UDP-N-acetylglucosamine-1-phosphate transferase